MDMIIYGDAALITEQRLKLRALGYNPVPLAGKAVTLKAWQKRTETTEHEIRSWAHTHPAQTNTGILTRNNPAFDIDILSSAEIADAAAEVAESELAAIGGRVMVRFGRKPKRAILCRTTEPFKKIRVELDSFFTEPDTGEIKHDAIELLGDGQQLACFGIHPDTQCPYEWASGSPAYVPATELPLITEADARRIVAKVVATLGERFGINLRTAAKEPRIATPTAEAKTTASATAWGAAALRSACEMIVNAENGSQEATLNTQCYGIGQLVAGGELPEAEALASLRAAASSIPDRDGGRPWTAAELARKVERSFTQGSQSRERRRKVSFWNLRLRTRRQSSRRQPMRRGSRRQTGTEGPTRSKPCACSPAWSPKSCARCRTTNWRHGGPASCRRSSRSWPASPRSTQGPTSAPRRTC
jgi:hypothetical protein